MLDLQNMLKGQIDVVEELLKEANEAFMKAEVTANQLQAEGQLLSRWVNYVFRPHSQCKLHPISFRNAWECIKKQYDGLLQSPKER